jgi:hypothetical protein
MSDRYIWLALFLLGCYHGINPGMGWLFAVALGLQEKSAAAVARAVVPITLGHLVSVAIVVALALSAEVVLPHAVVHRAAAALLLAFGGYKLVRLRHPRWVGMRVGFWGLALWGFLMASAHGAGLMLLPFVTTSARSATPSMAMPMPQIATGPSPLAGVLMVAVHTLGYVVTMLAVALVVYTKLGVGFLRTAWINVDVVWAAALIAAGLIALFT